MQPSDIEKCLDILTRAVDFLLRQAKLIDFKAATEAIELLKELRDTVKSTQPQERT